MRGSFLKEDYKSEKKIDAKWIFSLEYFNGNKKKF